jgi:hypothetical protein
MGVSGLSTKSVDALNSTIDAITPITSDWLPIIVIVAVVGIILALILGAFAFYRTKR